MKKPETIDQYISSCPPEIQKRLRDMADTIRKSAPAADEKISYGMPYFSFKGRLVYFAAHTNHIGFYPMISGIKAFQKELSSFKTSAGTVQFPHNVPLPLDLIKKIVQFRVNENLMKSELRAGKRRI